MIYPCISDREIIESIEYYINNPRLRGKDRPNTLESFKQDMKKYQRDGCSIIKSLIIYRKNSDLIADNALIVINKLLGDTKLLKKAKIISDGSYYMNRIWSFNNYTDPEVKIDIIPELPHYGNKIITSHDKEEFNKLSIKSKIDWIYHHFDDVYIQIPSVNCRNDIIDKINYNSTMDGYASYDCEPLYY